MAATYTEACDNPLCPVTIDGPVYVDDGGDITDTPLPHLRYTVFEWLTEEGECEEGHVHNLLMPEPRQRTFCSPNCLALWAEEQPVQRDIHGRITQDEH